MFIQNISWFPQQISPKIFTAHFLAYPHCQLNFGEDWLRIANFLLVNLLFLKEFFKIWKFFKKSLKFECAKQGAFSEGKSGKMHFFEKADFFNFFWVKGTQRSEISSQSIPYLWRGVYGAFKRPKKAKNCSKNDFFQNSLKSSFFGQFCSE